MKSMKTKEITTRTPNHKIVQQFADVFKNGGAINLETKTGFIYAVDMMLCKLEGDKPFFFDGRMWVEL